MIEFRCRSERHLSRQHRWFSHGDGKNCLVNTNKESHPLLCKRLFIGPMLGREEWQMIYRDFCSCFIGLSVTIFLSTLGFQREWTVPPNGFGLGEYIRLLMQQAVTLTYPCHRYYHEYPEVVAMMTRELYYGVNVDTNSVSIDPWAVDPSQPSWLFMINNFYISFSKEIVQLSIPTFEAIWKTWTVTHLQPNATYLIEDTLGNTQKEISNAEGVLQFLFLHSSSAMQLILQT